MGNGFAVIWLIYRATNVLRLMFKPHFTSCRWSCLQSYHTLTSNVDLKWPLNFCEKQYEIICSPSTTYIPSLKFKQHLHSWDIVFTKLLGTLTSGDLKWPLTFMKNNRDHLLTKDYRRAKFEVQATFISWDIMFTKFSYFDLWWPQMTFDLCENINEGWSTHQVPTYMY